MWRCTFTCRLTALQVVEHDAVLLPGNGVAADIQTMGHRIFVRELLGGLSLFECAWTEGRARAALVPLAMHRDAAWVPAAVPLDACTAAAAVHPQCMAILQYDAEREWDLPYAHAAGVGAGICCMSKFPTQLRCATP